MRQTPAVVSVNTITLPFTLCQHLTSLLHPPYRRCYRLGDTILKFKRQESLLNVLLGTGLYLY